MSHELHKVSPHGTTLKSLHLLRESGEDAASAVGELGLCLSIYDGDKTFFISLEYFHFILLHIIPNNMK